jgi:hypothetical protein
MHYLSFYVWLISLIMSSMFIHVVTNNRIFIFKLKHFLYSPIDGYLGYFVSWPLKIILQYTWEYRQLLNTLISVLWIYNQNGIAGSYGILFFLFLILVSVCLFVCLFGWVEWLVGILGFDRTGGGIQDLTFATQVFCHLNQVSSLPFFGGKENIVFHNSCTTLHFHQHCTSFHNILINTSNLSSFLIIIL